MIKYLPDKMLKKIAPKSKIEKLVTRKLTLNRAVLSFLADTDFLSKETLERTALKTIKEYKAKFRDEKKEGVPEAEAREDALNDNKLLVNRVQNTVVNQ